MWYLFFVVGGWWFFALCGLAVVLLFLAVETDSPFWAALTLGGYFAALALLGDFNVLDWLQAHPWKALTYAGAFFGIGTVWSVAKWWFYVRERRDDYNQKKLKFIKRHNLGLKVTDAIPEDKLLEYDGWIGSMRIGVARPDPSAHKSRIMTWMVYWPWSMLWTLINDPIKKLFKAIYARIEGVYERISDRLFGDVDAELALARQAREAYDTRKRQEHEDGVREVLNSADAEFGEVNG